MSIRKQISWILVFFLALADNAVAQSSGDATSYSIDTGSSALRVYVGRDGPLARMGHNHVVRTNEITGEIMLAANQVDSTASFSFPINSFSVDDQDERDRAAAAQREGFDTQPGRRAIEGTRENMMSTDVLNLSFFPSLSANISTNSVNDNQWDFSVELEIKGNTVELDIPAQVVINDSGLIVHAEFSLQHEDLGMSVFTALGGSLRVHEQLDFELHIEATPN